MRQGQVQKPKPPIDVDDVLAARTAGESIATYARRAGYSVGAIYDVLRRAGVMLRRPPRTVRDATDAALHALWRSIIDRCERTDHRKFALYGAKGVRLCSAGSSLPTPVLIMRVGLMGKVWGVRRRRSPKGLTFDVLLLLGHVLAFGLVGRVIDRVPCRSRLVLIGGGIRAGRALRIFVVVLHGGCWDRGGLSHWLAFVLATIVPNSGWGQGSGTPKPGDVTQSPAWDPTPTGRTGTRFVVLLPCTATVAFLDHGWRFSYWT